ncbi:hypothetical protein GGR53DRAFT_515806 [Hypoxylon sp. FL1150]|nr:hypothetical protein GGR53DRAFT_515806 [Hypoxylon sp. FL1150]
MTWISVVRSLTGHLATRRKPWTALVGSPGNLAARRCSSIQLNTFDTIEHIARHYVKNLESGNGLKHNEWALDVFSLGSEPANVSSLISVYRVEMLEKMLKPVEDVVWKLLRGAQNATKFCTHDTGKGKKGRTEKSACETSMLGAIIRSLHAKNLWPIPKPEVFDDSVSTLASKLKRINSKTCLDHHECQALPEINKTIELIETSSRFKLPEDLKQHLMVQAEKTGLDQQSEDGDEDDNNDSTDEDGC